MKKISTSALASGVIFLVVFNLLFFAFGEMPHPASVWVSYAFIHFSLILAIVVPLYTSGNKDFARQSNASLLVTGVYFAVAFVTGLVFILIAPNTELSIKLSWILQLVWLALFVIAFLPMMFANQHTNQAIARQSQEAMFLQDASSRIKELRDCVQDMTTMRQLDLLYTTIASSPIKSSPSVQQLEIQMLTQVSELEEAVDENNYEKAKVLCIKITRGVKERNRILRLISHE